MKLSFGELIIKNSNRKINYIDNLLKNIEIRFKDLLYFFNLEKINIPIQIVLWDNLEDFRNHEKSKGRKNIPNWLCGTASMKNNYHLINSLTLEELRKCESHKNATLQSLENLIIHELTHSVTRCFLPTQYKETKVWIKEALATSLSHQSHSLRFGQTISNLYKDDFIDYGAFHVIGDYLISQTSKEYIHELLINKNFLENQIPNIYNGVKEYFDQIILSNLKSLN